MDNKITNFLMISIVYAVYGMLLFYVVKNPDTDTTTKVIEAFILLASNIGTFFFTKHQIEKKL